jgi:hypothetical protein
LPKPNKNRYSGIMILANQYPISRASSVSIDTDLNEEEIREIGNEEVVERVDQTPTVSITVETNESASMQNLRYVTQEPVGTNITVNSFDGPTTDIALSVEEDNVLTRTLHVNDCVPVGISWNFDVGGLATESFNLEGDNYTWYINDYKIARVFNGLTSTQSAVATGLGLTATGCTVHSWGNTSSAELMLGAESFKPLKVYVDGQLHKQESGIAGTDINWTAKGPLFGEVVWSDYAISTGETILSTAGTRYRVLAVATGTTAIKTRIKNYTWGVTERIGAGALGGISKGMIDIVLTTGAASATSGTNFLRCQTASVDVDLARETLEELGHDRAFEKTLTLPVNVNVTFNTLASDLEEFAKFTTKQTPTGNNELSISEFSKIASLAVRIFDAKDTESTRTLKKELVITGLDISSQSYGVDVGGNATQDFTAIATNITVQGYDGDTQAGDFVGKGPDVAGV